MFFNNEHSIYYPHPLQELSLRLYMVLVFSIVLPPVKCMKLTGDIIFINSMFFHYGSTQGHSLRCKSNVIKNLSRYIHRKKQVQRTLTVETTSIFPRYIPILLSRQIVMSAAPYTAPGV